MAHVDTWQDWSAEGNMPRLLMAAGKYIKDNCKRSHVKVANFGRANVESFTTRLAEIQQE